MLQKISANAIFTGNDWLSNNEVLVYENTTGEIIEVIRAADGNDETITPLNGVLVPGFINCHCHLELSHLKAVIPQHTGIVNFILAILEQRNNTADEIVIAAMQEAEKSMLDNGIVAVGDISNQSISLSVKKNKHLYYHNFIEVSGFSPAIAEQRFAFAWQVYQAFQQYFPNQTALVPHAPYSVSSALFSKINNVTHPESIISIHNQESADENTFFETGEGSFKYLYNCLQVLIDDFFKPTGKTSLASVIHQLPAVKNRLLVHNSFITEADIELIREQQAINATNTHFCICANANLYIENCLPNIPLLHKSGIPMVIGTDSLASNHQLSIISELITLQNGFPELNTGLLLQWATYNGAKALGIDSWAGSFEKGKKPGIVLLEGINQNSLLDEATSIKKII